jgi:hypothetical protein
MLAAHTAGLAPAVVWLPMLAGDAGADVDPAAALVPGAPGARVTHFHDPERLVGEAIARSLGGDGQVAWDIYLFYGPGASWDGETPPTPHDWRHQLSTQCPWADPSRFSWGEQLPPALLEAAGTVLAQLGT